MYPLVGCPQRPTRGTTSYGFIPILVDILLNMAHGNVQDYVDQSVSVLESSAGLDEQTTRTKLIDPFIRLLGWDLYSPEVDLEHTVQMMSSDKQVDYGLILEEDPVAFVEAKGANSEITDYNIGQLGDYMQKKWVDYGLLTNGKHFIALKLEPSEGGPPAILELGTVELEELAEKRWLANLFSRDSLTGDETDEIAASIVRRERAVEHLRNNKEMISEEVTEVVTRDLNEAIRQETTEIASKFIDNLIKAIDRSDPVPKGGVEPPKPKPQLRGNLVRPSERAEKKIARANIRGNPGDDVVVVPAKLERGLDFLFRNQAWGFVHISQSPEHIAFYVTGGDGVSAVWYVARVDEVVDIEDADLVDDPAELIDLSDPNERRKKVIELEPDSLYELEDPIPYSKKYPQSLRYTTLDKLRTAETTEDLF